MSTEPFETSTNLRPSSESAQYASPYTAYSEWSEGAEPEAELESETRIQPHQ